MILAAKNGLWLIFYQINQIFALKSICLIHSSPKGVMRKYNLKKIYSKICIFQPFEEHFTKYSELIKQQN